MLIILKLSTLTRALAHVLEIFPIHFLWIEKRNLMQIFLRDSANINKIKLQSKKFHHVFSNTFTSLMFRYRIWSEKTNQIILIKLNYIPTVACHSHHPLFLSLKNYSMDIITKRIDFNITFNFMCFRSRSARARFGLVDLHLKPIMAN